MSKGLATREMSTDCGPVAAVTWKMEMCLDNVVQGPDKQGCCSASLTQETGKGTSEPRRRLVHQGALMYEVQVPSTFFRTYSGLAPKSLYNGWLWPFCCPLGTSASKSTHKSGLNMNQILGRKKKSNLTILFNCRKSPFSFLLHMFYRKPGILHIRNKLLFQRNISSEIFLYK